MADGAHVQTKTQRNLGYGREIYISQYENPTSVNLDLYRAKIAPDIMIAKAIEGNAPLQQLQVHDQDYTINNLLLSDYMAGPQPINAMIKQNMATAGGVGRLIIGSVEPNCVDDLGPITNIGTPISQTTYDNAHRIVVTDFSSARKTLQVDAQFSLLWAGAGRKNADFITYPISSRHILKESNGTIHAVSNMVVAGIHRIVHFYSDTGGETWYSEIVDGGEANVEYVEPSLTIDKNDGLHITYTRWDNILGSFYCLFSGGATPAGWDLVSGVGENFHDRFIMGGDSFVAFGADTQTHTWSFGWSGPMETVHMAGGAGLNNRATDSNHTGYTETVSSPSIVPLYRSLKVIRYNGLPPTLPVDTVLMLDTGSMPTNVTRYSAQDGYFIRGGTNVGDLGGSATHVPVFSGSLTGPHTGCLEDFGSGGNHNVSNCNHGSHTWSANVGAANNNPKHYDIVLGHVDVALSTLPAHVICMWLAYPDLARSLSGFFTKMSDLGGTLYNELLIGAAAYADGGGDLTTNHPDTGWITTSATTSGSNLGITGLDWWAAWKTHDHVVSASNFSDESAFPNSQKTLLTHTDADLSLGSFGKDVLYRYKAKGGAWGAQVNLSNTLKYFPQYESVILIDQADNINVNWSGSGYNATHPQYGTICDIVSSAGTWGAPATNISTKDADCRYPSINIDRLDDKHITWFDATNMNDLQYRKRTGGAWGAIESIDTNDYVGFPSNLIVDPNNIPHLVYARWDNLATGISDMYYTNRIGGAWVAGENISLGKRAAGYIQDGGQFYINTKGGLVIFWSGQGYGLFTAKYRPVMRYRDAAGNWTPPLASDAQLVLPDENKDTMNPMTIWNQLPLTVGVYQNYPVNGVMMLLLDDVHAGGDTADLQFFATNVLVGDAADAGQGGDIGSGSQSPILVTPTSEAQQGMMQVTTWEIVTRGIVNLSIMSPITTNIIG